MYAPDVFPSVQVEAREQRLAATFTDSQPAILARGELTQISLRVENVGTKTISEVWLVHGPSDELWLGDEEGDSCRLELIIVYCEITHVDKVAGNQEGTMMSTNCIRPPSPVRIPLQSLLDKTMLQTEEIIDVSLALHAPDAGSLDLHLMLLFRSVSSLNILHQSDC